MVAPIASQLPIIGDPEQGPPVFLFAYANDRHDDHRFLRNLAEERRRIKQALQGASDQGRCRLVECAGATLSEVLDECQRNARHLAVLHFAGHADSTSLLFETVDGHAHTVSSTSLTEFLGGIKGLHLVFLNGCSTKAQVAALLACGVRAVVATASSVPDEIATELAERFYKAIEGGATIGEAFQQAKGATMVTFGDGAILRGRAFDVLRSARDVVINDDTEGSFSWELFGEPGALARRLMPSRPTDHARCRVVITATLDQFDAVMIARVTAELQRVANDLSLQITGVQRGSVRLTITLSPVGARRLIHSWQCGDLTALCGFAVAAVEAIEDHQVDAAADMPSATHSAGAASNRDESPELPVTASAARTGNLRTGRRRLLFEIGGLSAVSVMIMMMVLVVKSYSLEQDDMSAAPPAGSGVAAAPPADAASRTTAGDPAIGGSAADFPGEEHPRITKGLVSSRKKIEDECRDYEKNQRWSKLEQCADKLRQFAPEQANMFKQRAMKEEKKEITRRSKELPMPPGGKN